MNHRKSLLSAAIFSCLVFGAQMVSENPEIGTQLGEEYAKPPEQRNTAKIAQLITKGFANSTLAGLMFAHAGTSIVPEVTKIVAPATAKALEQRFRAVASTPLRRSLYCSM